MIKVAIDGPAGAGKSSVSREVAKRCNLLYIDTGSIYRAITLLYLNNPKISIFKFWKTKIEFKNKKIFLNNEDVTEEIRTDKVNDRVSHFASKNYIRKFVDRLSLKISNKQSCLIEGRDIGTSVLPLADLKIYLDASPKVRAKRRLMQNESKNDTYDSVLESIVKRDKLDKSRKISPLKKADDAIHLLSDDMSEEEVIDFICDQINNIR